MSRVLLVGKGPPERGGIPSFLQTLLGSELAARHELGFLNLTRQGVPEGGRASVANATRTLRDALAVWKQARRHDVVHIHSALAPGVTALRAGLLALAARAAGARVVVHAHGGLVQRWVTTAPRDAVMRLALAPVHRVIAVSSDGERTLRRIVHGRVRLVHNGVDLDAFVGAEPRHSPPRLLYVGLLTPRKGVVDLGEASRLLHERGVLHELWLVGGTPDEGPAAEAEVRAALPEHAKLLGTHTPEEMPALYRGADVFCLPSWWEAMPLSVLEAMGAGLPVVATDVGEVSRVVRDGETGFVVPPHSPLELTAALETLLRDPDLRTRMGAAGREVALASFSSRSTAAALTRTYDELERGRP